MVASIATVASAGLGMLAGVAMASMPSSSSSSSSVKTPWRHASSSAPRCAACGGTGKEDCRMCARWSDGDCGACAGTRRAPCRCCGGGGSGRRAPVRVAAAARGAGMAMRHVVRRAEQMR